MFVFHKMADGFCEEGTGTCISNEKAASVLADFSGESEDVVLDMKPMQGNRDEASFTHKDDKKCCSKFASSAVHEEELVCVKEENPQKELSMQLETLCDESEGEDSCRKKRCADRYDSSESSDRCVRNAKTVYTKEGAAVQRRCTSSSSSPPPPPVPRA